MKARSLYEAGSCNLGPTHYGHHCTSLESGIEHRCRRAVVGTAGARASVEVESDTLRRNSIAFTSSEQHLKLDVEYDRQLRPQVSGVFQAENRRFTVIKLRKIGVPPCTYRAEQAFFSGNDD